MTVSISSLPQDNPLSFVPFDLSTISEVCYTETASSDGLGGHGSQGSVKQGLWTFHISRNVVMGTNFSSWSGMVLWLWSVTEWGALIKVGFSKKYNTDFAMVGSQLQNLWQHLESACSVVQKKGFACGRFSPSSDHGIIERRSLSRFKTQYAYQAHYGFGLSAASN